APAWVSCLGPFSESSAFIVSMDLARKRRQWSYQTLHRTAATGSVFGVSRLSSRRGRWAEPVGGLEDHERHYGNRAAIARVLWRRASSARGPRTLVLQ